MEVICTRKFIICTNIDYSSVGRSRNVMADPITYPSPTKE